MIMSTTKTERRVPHNEFKPYMKRDLKRIMEIMNGKPVTIILLDLPLHEFVPKSKGSRLIFYIEQ